MKTKFFSFVILAFMISSIAFSQKAEMNDTLKILLNNAKTKNKDLFLVFGWEGCSWCRLMDKYHDDAQVKAILSKYFMISYLDMVKSKAGENLFKKYGKGGTPSWTIFDINGKVIVDCDNGKGNVGYPATEDELSHYVFALKKALPNIPQSECDFLVSKLKEYRKSK